MDFATRLRAAISATDLSLEQLSARLRERGTPVSTSSLSGWQSGISRPERAGSLRALAELEGVLGLAPDELRSLLPGRPERAPEPPPLAGRESWRQPEPVARLLARFGAVPQDPSEPQRISRRVRQVFTADGQSDLVLETQLVRARRNGATRIFDLTRFDGLSRPPRMARLRGLTLRRFRVDTASGLAAFELLLDPPLAPGQVALVELTRFDPPGLDVGYLNIRVQPGTREVVLEAAFDPARLPSTITAFRMDRRDDPEQPEQRAAGVDVRPFFQQVWLDPAPGIYGLRWTW